MNLFSRRKVAALVAEFLGTGALAFVVLTVSRSQIGIPYFVAFAAGLAVVLFGMALSRDIQLNPAYTLALWTGRRVKTIKAVCFIAVQLLGGLAAFELYKYLSHGQPVQPLPSAFDAHIMVAEAFGAFLFTFIAAAALYQRSHAVVRTVVTGGGYALGVVTASSASAAFINPAVALSANAWVWGTYVAGPVLGAVIGVNLYGLLFADRERGFVSASASSKSSTARIVTTNVVEDSKAVKSGRLDKIEKAEKKAKKKK